MQTTRFYSKQEPARESAVELADELKQDVYIYKAQIGRSQSEYQLRTKDQIINTESERVIHLEKYDPRREKKERIVSENTDVFSNLSLLQPKLSFVNTGTEPGNEHHSGDVMHNQRKVGSWKIITEEYFKGWYRLYLKGDQSRRVKSIKQLKEKSEQIWANRKPK